MNYNPQNLHECELEKEKKRFYGMDRTHVDSAMTLVGLVASVSSIPQIIKIIQTHDVSGISLLAYIISLVSVLAWLCYGVYIKNKPLMITTFVTTILLAIVVTQIVVYS